MDKPDDELKPIISNRFFCIYYKKRSTKNEFTELGDAVDKFKTEFFKFLKIPEVVQWLAKRLK